MKQLPLILKLLLLFILISCCDTVCSRQNYAELIIRRVEKFKSENNRLPKDVSELGLTEKLDSPAFYRMQTDSTYMIWCSLSIGESKVYRSETKKWTEEG